MPQLQLCVNSDSTLLPGLSPATIALCEASRVAPKSNHTNGNGIQPHPENDEQPMKQLPVLKRWTVAELYAAEFPAPYFAIPNILPSGLTFIIARPKIGKSWLALQIATAVGSGGKVLDQDAKRGRVLYLALEDSPSSLQGRLLKQRAPADCDLTIMNRWMQLTRGGSAELQSEIERENYSLVIVDTLARAVGDADLLDQGKMNVLLAPLQEFAKDRNVSIVFVHHKRKGNGNGGGDVIDDALGATSIAGVGDAYIGIDRKRGERKATLQITGREIEEKEVAIDFDLTTMCWQVLGSANGIRTGTLQESIIVAIREHGGKATTREIANWLGKTPDNVSHELAELVTKNVLVRGKKTGKFVPYELIQ